MARLLCLFSISSRFLFEIFPVCVCRCGCVGGGGADGEDALCKALNGAGKVLRGDLKRRQSFTGRDDIGMKRKLFEVGLHCLGLQHR